MDDNACLLVTLAYKQGDLYGLLTCGLKLDPSKLPSEDILKYPLEPENRAILYELLPLEVRQWGEIADVQPLYAVHDISKDMPDMSKWVYPPVVDELT